MTTVPPTAQDSADGVEAPAEVSIADEPSGAAALPAPQVSPPDGTATRVPAPSAPLFPRAPDPPTGNLAMRVFSRAQTDLDVQTEGKRPATHEEVALAVHHAMIAEGLKDPAQAASPLDTRVDRPAVVTEGLVAELEARPNKTAPSIGVALADPATASPSVPANTPMGDTYRPSEKMIDTLRTMLAVTGKALDPHTFRTLTVLTMRDSDNLGGLSAKYESGGAGPGSISSGRADPGGASYGAYQLSSTKGTLGGFVNSDENLWAEDFVGLKPTTPAFDQMWQQVAKEDPELFRNAQYSYLHRIKYEPAVAAVQKATGVDLDSLPDAIRQVVFSMAVQHSRARQPLTDAVKAVAKSPGNGAPDYNEALIRQLYAQRSAYVIRVAKRMTKASDKKTLLALPGHRYAKEEKDALAALTPAN